MAEPVIDPTQLSERDQQALAATQGLGLKGARQTEAPAATPAATPQAGDKEIKPDPQPGPGTAPKATPPGDAGAAPIEINTPFGTKTFGATGGPVLSSFEDVQAYAKEHGVEMESVDSFRQVVSTITDLQKKAEEANVLQSMVNNYKTQFGSLPPEVANIVDAAIAGKEYKSIIQDIAAGASLDLSRSFGEHNAVNMIRQYVQPGLTQEAYDELTDSNKEAMNTMAKGKYESDQQRWQQATTNNANNKAKFTESYNKSIEDSMGELKKAFPTLDENSLKIVREKMEYGLKDSLFNPDNTYKPDAAIKISMQEFGQETIRASWDTIGQLAGQMKSEIQGKTNEDLVRRSDTPDQTGRQVADQSNVVAEAVKKATSFMKAR